MDDDLTQTATVARPRKTRAQSDEAKMSEPLRIVPGDDRRGMPVWKILGWITPTEPCRRECRRGTPAMRKVAEKIKSDEEFRRVQLQAGDAKVYASQWTWLSPAQIHHAQIAYAHMEKAGRIEPQYLVDHIDYAIERKVDPTKNKPLGEAIDEILAEQEKKYADGKLRYASYVSNRCQLRELKAFYPDISVYDLAFEKIVPPPPPQIATLPDTAYLELLGMAPCSIGKMRAAGAPLPKVIYIDGEPTWDTQGMAHLQAWLDEHPGKAKIPDPPPRPPIGNVPAVSKQAQSRVTIFCERPAKRKNRSMRLGEPVSLQTKDNRQNVVLAFLSTCVEKEWIPKLPRKEYYKSDRLRGKAPSLSPTECLNYLRLLEKIAPEQVFREVLQLGGHLRSTGESKRFEAWINEQTQTALPQILDWLDQPDPSALKFWPEFKQAALLEGYSVEAAGKLEVSGTISKTGLPRTVYIAPSIALWLAVYLPQLRWGAWEEGVSSARFENFAQYIDHHYSIFPMSSALIKKLKKVAPLKQNIRRHTNITYFFVRSGSMASTAKQSGNSQSKIELHYLDSGRTLEDALQFYDILPKGWSWAADRKSFIAPKGWIRPAGWVLPVTDRHAAARDWWFRRRAKTSPASTEVAC
ncbi:MAG TPA: hypothetical protein VG734_17465 [Lacunisphaera sp.]|nr:hypothetical protein [Lacunisphaera sp.]